MSTAPTPAATNRLTGLTVCSLESRMAKKMSKLLERQGARVLSAPSMQEVPLEQNEEVFRFFAQAEQGDFDLLILMTGVGTRALWQSLLTRHAADKLQAVFQKTPTLVRGPKALAAAKSLNLRVDHQAPEPNTWREIIRTLEAAGQLHGKHIAIQEYGVRNEEFHEALRAAGARVHSFMVYQWQLPDDLEPLQTAIRALISEEVDSLLITSAQQVEHLLLVAGHMGLLPALRRALPALGIFSIGPTSSERLRALQIFPDAEASPNTMDALVELAAERGPKLVKRKREHTHARWVRTSPSPSLVRRGTNLEPLTPSPYQGEGRGEVVTEKRAGEQERADFDPNAPFLRACRREPNDYVPVWLMRQAGRYMAEYQLVRRNLSFLDLCKNPELAATVTLDAVERLGVDAAIIFADILLPVEAMGIKLSFHEKSGPQLEPALSTPADIARLKTVEVEDSLAYVLQAIRWVRQEMHPRIPLLGFCGAPFTMAAYLIEGQGSKQYIRTKRLMHDEPEAWHELMNKLVTVLSAYLRAQIAAGCQAVQIFDSWVGCLSPEMYRTFVLPYQQQLIASVSALAPVIQFGTETTSLLPLIQTAGGHVMGLDWRVNIAATWDQLGPHWAVQGNMDPVLLFSKISVIQREAQRILDAVGRRPGFVFNIGHGILPQTPVDHVIALVDYVHEASAKLLKA